LIIKEIYGISALVIGSFFGRFFGLQPVNKMRLYITFPFPSLYQNGEG